MKIGCFITCFLFAAPCFAAISASRIEAYLERQGRQGAKALFSDGSVVLVDEGDGVRIGRWLVPGVAEPAESELPSEEESSIILEEAFQSAKPTAQRVLENEYFALVEEIYVAAGEEPPSLEEAKDLGQARAKIAKARQGKPGTGQGNKKTADDALEFLDMQLKLQSLDLELRGYDPDWRRLAKKHVLEQEKPEKETNP